MADTPLVKEKIQAGGWLIRAADAKRVPLRAALWVFESDDDRWRLVLESAPKAKLGPLDFSKLLYAAATSIRSPLRRDAAIDLLIYDVAVYTHPHPLSKDLRPKLGKAANVSRTRMSDAVLYRLEAAQQF